MKIELNDLKKNTKETVQIGDLNQFKEKNLDLNSRDSNNHLNDLSLYEWIRHTNSFHAFNQKCLKDDLKSQHPATFEEELPFYYIEFFSKQNEVILDPFAGTGTTSISAHLLTRNSVSIELNPYFYNIAKRRFKENNLDLSRHFLINSDSIKLLKSGELKSLLLKQNWEITLTLTSPPFFNILRFFTNKKNNRNNEITNYGNENANLEQIDEYSLFLDKLSEFFGEIYNIMRNRSYLVINVQNFYKKSTFKNGKIGQEMVFFAWDLTKKLSNTHWIPCGEQIWAYPNKKIYPFGNPYVYLANITHSYNLIFYKDIYKK